MTRKGETTKGDSAKGEWGFKTHQHGVLVALEAFFKGGEVPGCYPPSGSPSALSLCEVVRSEPGWDLFVWSFSRLHESGRIHQVRRPNATLGVTDS